MDSNYTEIFSLKGKTAVITGGSTGLGLAMAQCMLKAGAKVIAISISDLNPFKDSEYEDRAFIYRFDITDTNNTQKLADKIISEHGPIDILCNNAGNHLKKPIEEMSVKDFTDVLDVHLVGAFAMTKAFVPHMKANGGGSILFTASMTSFIGQPFVTAYSAAKAGYLGMVHTLATEVSGAGIRVNAIAPGWIDTPLFRQVVEHDPQRLAKILDRTPMNKLGDPADIGWAAVYLCSDAARFITGVCLPVDGGALIGF